MAIDSGDCHHQRQSPLYGKPPRELRALVFHFALQEDFDLTFPYHFRCSVFGLGDYVSILSMALLRTCRLVYCETRHIPFARYPITSFYPFLQVMQTLPRTLYCSAHFK